jgi:hypothetical protein
LVFYDFKEEDTGNRANIEDSQLIKKNELSFPVRRDCAFQDSPQFTKMPVENVAARRKMFHRIIPKGDVPRFEINTLLCQCRGSFLFGNMNSKETDSAADNRCPFKALGTQLRIQLRNRFFFSCAKIATRVEDVAFSITVKGLHIHSLAKILP